MTLIQDDIEEKYQIAKRLFENGILKAARSIFVELTLKSPFKWEFWFALASVYGEEKKYVQAIISYKMAIALNPENDLMHFNLAECFLSKNDKKQALEHLKLVEKHTKDLCLKDKVQILIKQNLK